VIKAVIFDFFGVLGLRGSASFRKIFFGDDPVKFQKVEELQDQMGLGNLGYDEFIDQLAILGDVSRAQVLEYTENYQPNTELLDYIRSKLKPKYKIGIISNAGEDWVLKILGEKNIQLFDDIVLSYKAGMIKPEPGIYELSVKNLGIEPEECVFVDDILRYCQGAEQLGMNTVWYQDFERMKAGLEKILASVPDN
jgi:HAD superfamily hydrolase (TIGR01509 family)